MLYSHKGNLVTVNHVEENGTVLTHSGEIPVVIGDVLLVDDYGKTTVTNKKWFDEHYVPVEKVKPKQKIKVQKSPFETTYAQQLVEFSNMRLNQEEDTVYILGTEELNKNKAF